MRYDLYVELNWYGARQQVRNVRAPRELVGALDDAAPVPMWGFALLASTVVLGRRQPAGYRLFVPPGVVVEKSTRGDRLHRVPGQPGVVELGRTDRVRFRSGASSLSFSLQPRTASLAQRRLSTGLTLTLALFAAFFTGLSAFACAAPSLDVALEAPSWGTHERLVRLLPPRVPPVERWDCLRGDVQRPGPARRRLEVLPCHFVPGTSSRSPPRISIRLLSVRGASDGGAILQVLQAHQNEVLASFLNDYRCHPRFWGTVTLEWRISKAGAARDATVTGTTLSWNTAGAIALRLSSWRFPEPAGLDEKVSVTLAFNAAQ